MTAGMRGFARLSRAWRALRGDGRLLLAFCLVALLIFLFVRLASEMMEGETLAFDRALMRALRSAADPAIPAGPWWLQRAMLDVTALGGPTCLVILTVIVAFYLLVARKAAAAASVVAAIGGGALLGALLKAAFLRPRPELAIRLIAVQGPSFPSGHAMNSAIVFLTLGALLARTEEDPRLRLYLIAVAIVLTLAVGASRVYLGVHWPSDVLAGWFVGAAWAMLCLIVARFLPLRRD